MPFAENILLKNICQWEHIEKLKTTFHFLKEKRKENQWSRPFASAISGNTFFHWEVLKHETEAMLTWVRNKLTIYYIDLVRM